MELGEYFPDNLIVDAAKIVTDEVTLQLGQNLKRGTVLGYITRSVPTTGTADGGNTGNGTMTIVQGRKKTKTGVYTVECITAVADGGVFSVTDPDSVDLGEAGVNSYSGTGNGTLTELKAGKHIKSGLYTVVCVTAVTNGGVFNVFDPDNNVIGSVTIAPGAGGTGRFVSDEINFLLTDGSTDFILADTFTVSAYDNEALAFQLNDGSTDFVVGDKFTVTVAAGTNQATIVDADNSDGTQTPKSILAEDIDATLAAKKSPVYIAGVFNPNQLIFGGNDTIETHRDAMRDAGMFVQSVLAAGGND